MSGSAISAVSTLLLAFFLHGNRVRAQDGNGGSADGAGNSQIGSTTNDGNVGSNSSSANLSTGAIVAICVVAAFVVVGIGEMQFVFWCTTYTNIERSHTGNIVLFRKEATVGGAQDNPQDGYPGGGGDDPTHAQDHVIQSKRNTKNSQDDALPG